MGRYKLGLMSFNGGLIEMNNKEGGVLGWTKQQVRGG